MDRKTFLQQLGVACLCSTSLAVWLEGCAGIHYAQHEWQEKDKQIILKKTEFRSEKEGKDRKFVIVRNEKLPFPIYVWKHETEFIALYMCCTHKGCELNAQNEFLICPCHGAEFDRFGKVQNPPADKDLLRFEVKEDTENVYVLLAF
ncbi:MAG: ubiquinol-cytochrome c reductase iron-sulfur subunit [Bacteroidia bacterium]